MQPSQSRYGHWSPVMHLDFDNRGWERISNNSTRLNCPDQLMEKLLAKVD
jgi:hypothetical protein